ncbi:MAG: CehA/McbA family metallohydrolase [Dictyoglomaceae bacterium]|nr:CehA/McbA family metallohydrolase [Dictyoglomaceae bacterium]
MKEYIFNLELFPEDSKKHIPIYFDVPTGAKEIIIENFLEPRELDLENSKKLAKEALAVYINQGDNPLNIKNIPNKILDEIIKEFIPIRNLINFRIFDAKGNFRGTGDERFSRGIPIKIGENFSSLGCVEGKIWEGKWRIVIETHAIVKKGLLSLKIKINNEERENIPQIFKEYVPVLKENIYKDGWLACDLHIHSHHSDGKLSLEEVIKSSIKRGLDFIFLTDHNKISGFQKIKNEKFPIFCGIEFTTFWGHFTSFGLKEYIEWDIINPLDGIKKVADFVHSQGGLICIAHPFTIGDPVCTGCRCTLNIDWRNVDAMEIWAGSFNKRRHENTEALKLWRNLLNSGYKITGIGATDMHTLKDITPDCPITYVYVKNLNLENVLKSLKEGRVYITRGPKVNFSINDMDIGGKVRITEEKFNLRYSCEEFLDLKIFYNGKVIIEIPKTSSGNIELFLKDRGYIYLEFWKDKELYAITNPIYVI